MHLKLDLFMATFKQNSNISYTTLSFHSLINNINNNRYALPNFQRQFVWKMPDICNLAKSIIKQVSIQSFLILEYSDSLPITYNSLNTYDSGLNEDTNSLKFVLDGQQRITAIAKIFCDKDDKYGFYLDMYRVILEAYPEWESKIKFLNPKASLTAKMEKHDNKDWIKNFESKNKTIQKFNNRCVLISQFISSSQKYIRQFLNTLDMSLIDNDMEEKIYAEFDAILKNIISLTVPVAVYDKNSDLEQVLFQFEMINKTGIKLHIGDLVNSMMEQGNTKTIYQVFDEFINNHQNQQFKEIAKYMNFKKGEAQQDLLKILNIVENHQRNNDCCMIVKYNKQLIELMQKDNSFYFKSFDKNKELLEKALLCYQQHRLFELSNSGWIFHALISLFICYPYLMEQYNEKLLSAVIKTITLIFMTDSPMITLAKEIEEVAKALQDESMAFEKIKQINQSMTFPIDIDDMLSMRKDNVKAQAILRIMKYEKYGKFGMDLFNCSISPNSLTDVHHILPKATIGDDKKFDSICNYTLLNKIDNQTTIKDRPFHEYIEWLEKQYGHNRFEYICEQNMLPKLSLLKDDNGQWKQNYEDIFIMERGNQILEYLKQYFEIV